MKWKCSIKVFKYAYVQFFYLDEQDEKCPSFLVIKIQLFQDELKNEKMDINNLIIYILKLLT